MRAIRNFRMVHTVKTEQFRWSNTEGWFPGTPGGLGKSASLVIIFSDSSLTLTRSTLDDIASLYPNARLFGCSSAGEIVGTQVLDHAITLTAISFEHTHIQGHSVRLSEAGGSYEAGKILAKALDPKSLVHAFAVADGCHQDGVPFVRGITDHLPDGVSITGGLAGSRDSFRDSFDVCNGYAEARSASVIGFYGDHLSVGCAALSGWRPFGPHRLVTRSIDEELFELDGKSALHLYKEYLGEHAAGLPETALLFPLEVREEGQSSGVVRAIISVDESRQSISCGGDVPIGSYARLMRGSHDDLIDGASGAAASALKGVGPDGADLAIIVSCVARKLALKQRVEEEIEVVRNAAGPKTCISGFYSYGEIGPNVLGSSCRLHNQTMQITTFREDY